MSNFRPINRTGFLLPPSVDEWLPQRHLARFVVEVVDGLELTEFEQSYRGSGSASYHPAMLLGLLVYGYATRVFSSRALERATYDSVAFRLIAGNEHPDHDTIAHFRKRFLKHIEPLFVEVLKVARAMGRLKMGTVALDGTKVHVNASRHSALSYRHAEKLEKRLKQEVQQLLQLAEQADAADVPDGMSIPEELERREARLAAITDAVGQPLSQSQPLVARLQQNRPAVGTAVPLVELHHHRAAKQLGEQNTLSRDIRCHAKASRVLKVLVAKPFYHERGFCFSRVANFPG